MSAPESWLGQLPAHWQVRRLGTLGALAKGSGGSKVDNREVGVPVVRYGELYSRFKNVIARAHTFIAEDAAERYTPLRPGTIVFAGSGEDPEDIGKSALSLLEEPAYVGGDTVLFTPQGGEADPLYLTYVLESRPLKALKAIRSTGFTVVHISAAKLKTLPIPLPPITEQRAIVRYLDHETAQIDTLIDDQERLIELLRERRTSVVDRVVWAGLDGSAPISPSGIDPVPFAPSHWRRVRNKNLMSEAAELSLGGETLLSVSHLTGITPRQKSVSMAESEDLSGYRRVNAGELVINTMWAWMGALGVSRVNGIVSPAYGVYQPHQGAEFHPAYFDYLYRSRPYVTEMTRHSRGIWSSRLRIYPEVFLRLPIVVPPLAEQVSIARYLDTQTAKIDTLVAEAERFIELSRERRTALVTATVTGQVDVPHEVA
jgi:type I restriction enzyme S subunit